MGYTHYANQHRDFTGKEWGKICTQAKVIFFKAARDGIALGSWEGEGGEPEVTDSCVSFNGVDGDSHESFVLNKKKPAKYSYEDQAKYDREGAFSFCKTASKPYDPVVVSVMAMVKSVAPGAYDIASDGDANMFTEDAHYWKG